MRTLEEIKKADYEDLTCGELFKYDISCEHCPFFEEFCSGGGGPDSVPCEMFNDTDILSEQLEDFIVGEMAYEDAEDKRLKKEEEKRLKKEREKQKRFEYKLRNIQELSMIANLKKKNKSYEKHIENIESLLRFSKAVNFANDMFEKASFSHPDNMEENPFKDEIEKYKGKIEENKKEIIALKATIKENEKKFKMSKKMYEKEKK